MTHPAATTIKSSRAAPVARQAVTESRLANGLRVIVIPDHRAPIVTHMVWYCNGAADDPPAKSGIAHFLEHMMFKGTSLFPAGRFSSLIADVGGEENAFTSHDFTAYFQRVPSQHLEVCMRYEADRMSNLNFLDEVVAPERDVVLEERRMRAETNPSEVLGESLRSTLFSAHPYGRPVIGWQHEIKEFVRQDAMDYYARFYTPENAILVVAGDVEPSDTIALATNIYGPTPSFGTAPVRRRPRQPKPTSLRSVSHVDSKVGQTHFQWMQLVPSYHTAAPGQAEALHLLSFLLGGGQTSSLFKRLVMQDKAAVSAGAYYDGRSLDACSFGLHALPAQGVTLTSLKERIEEILSNIRRDGFSSTHIRRAKNQLIANAVYAQDSQTSLAQMYGTVLTTGGQPADIASWPDQIERVDAEALHQALELLDIRTAVLGFLETAAA